MIVQLQCLIALLQRRPRRETLTLLFHYLRLLWRSVQRKTLSMNENKMRYLVHHAAESLTLQRNEKIEMLFMVQELLFIVSLKVTN
jgi:hypothetical protein